MISVIIPTYNEEDQIEKTIQSIFRNGTGLIKEIIIADGGSNDKTIEKAAQAGAKIILSAKGRAVQMNKGAQNATESILYFIHSDSIPPEGFAKEILKSINTNFVSGCFRLEFDYQSWFLKLQCWFTRFDIDAFRYGDQSLFVKKEAFLAIGGFDENLTLMEDNEIIGRLKKYGRFRVMEKTIITSARKYADNGVFKTQFIFYTLFILYKLGYSHDKIVTLFRAWIKQNKV